MAQQIQPDVAGELREYLADRRAWRRIRRVEATVMVVMVVIAVVLELSWVPSPRKAATGAR